MPRKFEIDADSLPNLPGMMLATIEALKDLGGSGTIQEIDERVIDLEGVTETEQAFQMKNHENRPRVNYYLAWSRTYLKRGKALANSARGIWALTESGAAISELGQTRSIYDQVNLEERAKVRAKRKEAKDSPAPIEESAEEGPDNDEDWKGRLLSVIGAMHPSAFERLSQRLLREAGFTKVEVRGKSGDGGIDGLGILRVNLVSFQVYFQCKKWIGSVGSKEIRDFRGAVQGRADKGLFITTGHFTSQASDEATRDGAIAIDLIDGDRLCELLRENSLGVETTMIPRITIDPEWFANI
jgi:restriction system protein